MTAPTAVSPNAGEAAVYQAAQAAHERAVEWRSWDLPPSLVYQAAQAAHERAVSEARYAQETIIAATEAAYHARPIAPLAIVPPRRVADILAEADCPLLLHNRATAAGISNQLASRLVWLVRKPAPFTRSVEWRNAPTRDAG